MSSINLLAAAKVCASPSGVRGVPFGSLGVFVLGVLGSTPLSPILLKAILPPPKVVESEPFTKLPMVTSIAVCSNEVPSITPKSVFTFCRAKLLPNAQGAACFTPCKK